MTPQQKALVRTSWEHVVPIAGAAAGMFYDRLFETDPGLRTMFRHTDMQAQKNKLVEALGVAIDGLDSPEFLATALKALGRRHVSYGVTDAHYDAVGAALLWTLEKGLGDAWSPAVGSAWAAVYGFVADAMKTGAAEISPRDHSRLVA